MKNLTLTALMFLTTATFAIDAKATSILNVYESALKNDFTYQKDVTQLRIDSEEYNIAKSRLLPQITANYSKRYLEESNVIRQLVNGINGDFVESDVSVESDIIQQGWMLRLQQPLFDAPRWYQYKQGETEQLIAELTLEHAHQNLIMRVLAAYLDVLRLHEAFASSSEQLAALTKQYDATIKKFESGMITKTDAGAITSGYRIAQLNNANDELELDKALQTLSMMTGKQYDTLKKLRQDIDISLPFPNSIDEWVKMSSVDNLNIVIAKQQALSAEYNYKSHRWEHSPKVNIGAFVSKYKADGTTSSSLSSPFILDPDEKMDTFGIQLTVEVPIYSGGSISANRRKASHEQVLSQYNVSEVTRNVERNTRQAYLSIVNSIERLQRQSELLISAQEQLKSVQSGQNLGLKDLSDEIRAKNFLYSVQRDYSNSLYDYLNFYFQLRYYSGKLNAGDIYRLDAFLESASQQAIDFKM